MTVLNAPKQNAYGEEFYEELNGKIFTNSSSKTVFERYFKDSFDVEYQLNLIVGTDSGLLPKFIYEKYRDNKKGRQFVFFEQPEVIEKVDFSYLPDWISIEPAGVDLKELSADWIEYMMTKRIGLYKSIAVIDEISTEIKSLWVLIKDQYSRLQFSDLANNHTKPFVEAQLKNFPRNNFPIKQIKNRLKGQKAIMIAGGPSLDQSIEWIKEVQDSFFIFAVGRVSKKLYQAGVTPDFIISVDPHELSYDNSKQMFYFSEESILLNCFHIAPRLLSQWSGISCYFGELYPWEEASGNSTSPGPTVLHSAVVQAAYLGCDEIYLTGVDLCFYNGQTHVSGTAESNVGKLGIKDLSKVLTYSGEEAETDIPFAQGVIALGSIATYLQETRETKLFNLSQNAAKVENIAYRSLDDISLPEGGSQAKYPVLEQLKLEIKFSLPEMQTILKSKLKEMQSERALIISAQSILTDAIKSIKQYQKDFNSKALAKAQKHRLKLEKKLDEQAMMLFYFGYSYFSQVMKPVEDSSNLSDDEIAHTLSTYFDGMKKSVKDFIALIDTVITEIKFMQKEFDDNSLPCELETVWEQHKEFGRGEVWTRYHSGSPATEQQVCLDRVQEKFYEDISTEHTKQAQMLQRKAYGVTNLIDKIKEAFEVGNIQELKTLLDPVQTLKNPIDQLGLSNFIEASIAAIEAPESAVELYEKNEHPKLQVYIKSQLLPTYMKTEQHDKALKTLQDLCELSADYMIPYADYLNILGRPDLATEVALELFRQEQTNLPALIKVVHYAHKAGLNDVFSDALSVALSIDPFHPELQSYTQK